VPARRANIAESPLDAEHSPLDFAMTNQPHFPSDAALDLVLERVIDVPIDLVWAAWTQPEHIKVWFTPRPWTITDCEVDLRPGGMFRTDMCSPDGQIFPNIGCFLEIVPNERLVFTDALLPGFRPSAAPFMTAIIELEPHGTGTKYRATAIHSTVETRDKHEAMGFFGGWATALDQLVAHVKSLQGGN
jgi:uncharacterized protein YndB with AHSA1/START domain